MKKLFCKIFGHSYLSSKRFVGGSSWEYSKVCKTCGDKKDIKIKEWKRRRIPKV